MKAKIHILVRLAGDRRFYCQPSMKRRRHLKAMAEQENRKEVAASPFEPGCEETPRSVVPDEQGPRHTVHWEPVRVAMKQWG
jgi:hypothetical protein